MGLLYSEFEVDESHQILFSSLISAHIRAIDKLKLAFVSSLLIAESLSGLYSQNVFFTVMDFLDE